MNTLKKGVLKTFNFYQILINIKTIHVITSLSFELISLCLRKATKAPQKKKNEGSTTKQQKKEKNGDDSDKRPKLKKNHWVIRCQINTVICHDLNELSMKF